MKTQEQYFRDSHRRIADANNTFMDVMTGTNPLTPEEIAKLIEKRPALWGRFKAWGKKED